jgi:hypothetical protein
MIIIIVVISVVVANCVVVDVICVVLCIVYVQMCTVLPPPCDNPIAVIKYIVNINRLVWRSNGQLFFHRECLISPV